MFNHDLFLLPSENIGAAINLAYSSYWRREMVIFYAFTHNSQREIEVSLNKEYLLSVKVPPLLWLQARVLGYTAHPVTCYCLSCLEDINYFGCLAWKITEKKLLTAPYAVNSDPSSGRVCLGNNYKPITLRECVNLFWNSKFTGDYSNSYYSHKVAACGTTIHQCPRKRNQNSCSKRNHNCSAQNGCYWSNRDFCHCCQLQCNCNVFDDDDPDQLCRCCSRYLSCNCKCVCPNVESDFQKEIETQPFFDCKHRIVSGHETVIENQFDLICLQPTDGIFVTQNLENFSSDIQALARNNLLWGFAKKLETSWEIKIGDYHLEIPEDQINLLGPEPRLRAQTTNSYQLLGNPS